MSSPQAPDSLPSYLVEDLSNQDDNTLEDTRDYIDELLTYRHQTSEEDDDSEDSESIDDAGPQERDRRSESG